MFPFGRMSFLRPGGKIPELITLNGWVGNAETALSQALHDPLSVLVIGAATAFRGLNRVLCRLLYTYSCKTPANDCKNKNI